MTVVSPYDARSRTCPVCGRRFKDIASLIRHMEGEHPGVKVAEDRP